MPAHTDDPEAAALELITRLPAEAMRSDTRTTLVLQSYAAVLRRDRCFVGLVMDDAKYVAIAICADITQRDNAADMLLNRARNALAGADGIPWRDRDRAARAFTIAATALAVSMSPVSWNLGDDPW